MLAKPPERCSPDCELSGTQNYGSEVGGPICPYERHSDQTGVPSVSVKLLSLIAP
jgi:hypothetical protein